MEKDNTEPIPFEEMARAILIRDKLLCKRIDFKDIEQLIKESRLNEKAWNFLYYFVSDYTIQEVVRHLYCAYSCWKISKLLRLAGFSNSDRKTLESHKCDFVWLALCSAFAVEDNDFNYGYDIDDTIPFFNHVYYFEYLGQQISFHCSKLHEVPIYIPIYRFHGWDGMPQDTFPWQLEWFKIYI